MNNSLTNFAAAGTKTNLNRITLDHKSTADNTNDHTKFGKPDQILCTIICINDYYWVVEFAISQTTTENHDNSGCEKENRNTT